MPISLGIAVLCSGLLTGCSESTESSPPQVTPTEPVAADTRPASTPPAKPDPAAPAPAPAPARFASAPVPGWIARATCHMGACTWNRYERGERDGGDDAPRYALRITQGESRHPGDYPIGPEGVEIAWDAGQVPAEARCSRASPYASMDDQGGALSLNPHGVAGVEQGIANLYFATCHGVYGDDGALAEKFGYDLR